MSGQKSSRWFMFSHSYTSSRKTHSLLGKFVCEWVCAKETNPQRNVRREFLFHSSPSVRISPARKTIWPPAASNGTESLIVSTRDSSRSPDAAPEVTVCWPLLLHYWAYKDSNLFCYKAGWSPKAVKTLQQLLPANKRLAITGNTLALRLRQLMQVLPRTRVHWECRRERETRIISGVCFGSCYGLVISTHSEH